MSNTHNDSDSDVHRDAEDRPRTPARRRLTLLLSAAAFFVSYVLTAGPAVFIVRRIDLPLMTTIVERLYAPLILITKLNIPVISPVIQAYVRMFR